MVCLIVLNLGAHQQFVRWRSEKWMEKSDLRGPEQLALFVAYVDSLLYNLIIV